jgi:hypothetical protein
MTTTINASPSNGIVQTADGSGVLKVQSNGVTTNALAWVNFNGTGTVAIRSSYNVSSITDNGAGDYTVNFATALSDANYCPVFGVQSGATTSTTRQINISSSGDSSAPVTKTTTALRILVGASNAASLIDVTEINVLIFGN